MDKPNDHLPGGLVAIQSPGPTDAHYSFTQARGVIFCADLLTHHEGEQLEFVPGEYQDDPAETRDSVRLRFKILCMNHGCPVTRVRKPPFVRRSSGMRNNGNGSSKYQQSRNCAEPRATRRRPTAQRSDLSQRCDQRGDLASCVDCRCYLETCRLQTIR